VNSFNIQVVNISCHIITIKYKNIKMINLIHISILIFVFYCVILDETNKTRSHLYMF
jgi:hypothetical protein